MERLQAIGWTPEWASAWNERHGAAHEGLVPARVCADLRAELRVRCEGGTLAAEISGRMRYLAAGPEELPAVGDWVALAPLPGEAKGVVHDVLPRATALVRKAPDRPADAQVLATNVDVAFVVTSANRDFNPRRIERTLALAREGGVSPVLVISKWDLAEERSGIRERAEAAAPGTPLLCTSAVGGEGLEELREHLGAGVTAVLLGSSGVGKSTLANWLCGEERLATSGIREDDDRGRHTTSHRELVELPRGGALIDTPGLREIGLLGDDAGGVESAFPDVEALLGTCRFADCGHAGEPGCAIGGALQDGSLAPERWAHYQKLLREAEYVERSRDAHARHVQRKKRKRFAKMVRNLPDKRGR